MLNITTWYKQKFICQWNQENLLHLVRVWDQVLISVIQIITIIVMIDSATSSVVSAVFSSVYNMSSSVPSRAFKWFHDDIGVQFFPHIIDQLCKYYLPLWRFWYHSATTPPTSFQHLFHWAIEANIQWLKHWSHATLWWPQHRFYGIVLGVVGGPFAKTRKCI